MSDARALLVNLEDLWWESRSHNIPGTTSDARPNWRPRARYSLEAIRRSTDVEGTLRRVDRLRSGSGRARRT